ncbi:MAG: S46 family peptidase, partial [Bacteroidales bacterium]|nr:S46 family peptidase [Bacteroidales bacterium]
FVANPNLKTLQKDPIYNLTMAFVNKHANLNKEYMAAYSKLGKANRLYIDALRKMDSNKNFYPDANFTMRLTYGQVKNYMPADGIIYKHFTTVDGIMEKEDPNNTEFIVPEKLKQLFMDKQYGLYGENGTVNVAFLSNNDITGGNSGSPVINGKGELIGLAFDGNWEAMSGDIAFEPELQRTISVDIRYVLFIIDKYAGATNLINEMKLVGSRIE